MLAALIIALIHVPNMFILGTRRYKIRFLCIYFPYTSITRQMSFGALPRYSGKLSKKRINTAGQGETELEIA